MCGINGIYRYRPEGRRFLQEDVERVRDSMSTRGPDDAGLWISSDHRIGLGHRRLSIIDLSPNSNQPMASHDGRFQIVFNGEIYNYKALKAELSSSGHAFRTQSDTEVILAMYEMHGLAMLSRLRGMFTFAIWDSRENRLVIARGPMGIKPLYYSVQDSTFQFASQVKALIAGGNVDTSPEPAGHIGFFLWGHVPEPFTLFRGIRQLPAGSYLIVDEHGPKHPIIYQDPKQWFENPRVPDDALACLRESLQDSVDHHFVSDVPVSLFLSAGRDSAAILSLASETDHNPVHAVTLGFQEYKGTPDDECPMASRLAEQFGASHIAHFVTGDQFKSDVGDLLSAMDQPSIDGANTYFVCKVAASLGVRVALSGLGADEIFGGYHSFAQVPKLARSLAWSNRVPRLGQSLRKALTRIKSSKSPKYAGILEYGGTIEGAFLLRRGLFMPWEIGEILDRDFTEAGLEELATVDRLRAITSGLPSPHSKVVMLELYWYMQGRLLRDSDWASMAHSLELRVPFVDTELMKRIGPWIASSKPPTKDDMVRCLANPLPSDFLSRPKTGFNIPVERWALDLDPSARREHSHRQWAKYVYRNVAGEDMLRRS
ncbi:MAG: asparagine synthase (glutamine-hydrolyzing) [Chlorobia bacterium]|nr:asparagine synthase (glutamine-hydrolyzing) [Fimbriimonadaceae bacterium]